MYCPNCGTRISKDTRTCPICGRPIPTREGGTDSQHDASVPPEDSPTMVTPSQAPEDPAAERTVPDAGRVPPAGDVRPPFPGKLPVDYQATPGPTGTGRSTRIGLAVLIVVLAIAVVAAVGSCTRLASVVGTAYLDEVLGEEGLGPVEKRLRDRERDRSDSDRPEKPNTEDGGLPESEDRTAQGVYYSLLTLTGRSSKGGEAGDVHVGMALTLQEDGTGTVTLVGNDEPLTQEEIDRFLADFKVVWSQRGDKVYLRNAPDDPDGFFGSDTAVFELEGAGDDRRLDPLDATDPEFFSSFARAQAEEEVRSL